MAKTDNENSSQPQPETIEALFLALESPLLGYAHRLLGSRETSEDVVQEAFMRLHLHFESVREPRAWLYRTVHNLALNQRRQTDKVVSLSPSRSDASPLETDPTDPQPLPDEEIARWEQVGQVRLGMESLDARSRLLIELKFKEDLSYQEMSQRSGLTVGHVGYLLHHALKTLAKELAKNGMAV